MKVLNESKENDKNKKIAICFSCVLLVTALEIETVKDLKGSKKVNGVWSGWDFFTMEFTTLRKIQDIILFSLSKLH